MADSGADAPKFVVEDRVHAEWLGKFDRFSDAVEDIRRRLVLPPDQPPNAAPCGNWRDCRRRLKIIEYDTRTEPWKQISDTEVLRIEPHGFTWLLQDPA